MLHTNWTHRYNNTSLHTFNISLLHITDIFDTIVDHDIECLPRAILADGRMNVGGAPSLGFSEGPTSAAS